MRIQQLQFEQIEPYAKHIIKHMSESGIDNLVYVPRDRGYVYDLEEMKEKISKRMKIELTMPGWERAFVIWDEEKIVGHLQLRAPNLENSMHRNLVGIGLDLECRGKKLGTKLMEAGIEWLKKETKVEWLDLNVFSHNLPAIALYKKLGFKEVGRVVDMFRVDGESICDLHMTLKLV